jgi:ATP phosphoribosyltransferase
MEYTNGVNSANGVNGVNGVNGINGINGILNKARSGSRSLPFLTDTLGNSLNDRLLFAVPKSMSSPEASTCRIQC